MGIAKNIGSVVSDLTLLDTKGISKTLLELSADGPLLLVIYPGDFTPVCTTQLCEYRDNFSEFKKLKLRVIGMSADSAEKHKKFKTQYQLPFDLYTDQNWETAKALGCTSAWMLGMVSRAICLIKVEVGQAVLRYRSVEKLAITRMKSEEIVREIENLL